MLILYLKITMISNDDDYALLYLFVLLSKLKHFRKHLQNKNNDICSIIIRLNDIIGLLSIKSRC